MEAKNVETLIGYLDYAAKGGRSQFESAVRTLIKAAALSKDMPDADREAAMMEALDVPNRTYDPAGVMERNRGAFRETGSKTATLFAFNLESLLNDLKLGISR